MTIEIAQQIAVLTVNTKISQDSITDGHINTVYMF